MPLLDAEYWQSLEELAHTPDFLDRLGREFPEGASEWNDPHSRRRFLRLMGASLALAGVQGCISGPPQEEILPYVHAPEGVIPGRPRFYATAFTFRGYGEGVLVESHAGRPTKIEGNPDHPASLGGTSVFAQASVLDLYDPGRSIAPRYRGETTTLDELTAAIQDRRARFQSNAGDGLRLLTETVTSPTLGDQLRDLLLRYPNARWHHHDAVSSFQGEQGLAQVFGRPVAPVYHIERADVILSVDSDFLYVLPGSLRYARRFADRRRVRRGTAEMNRLYVVESSPSLTGAVADHRLPLAPSRAEAFVEALAALLGIAGAASPSDPRGINPEWISGVARDLERGGGRSLVIAGESMSPEAHALVHGINEALGGIGTTVEYTDPVDERPSGGTLSLETLVHDMRSGRVDTLVMLGGNPIYSAPADLDFGKALDAVPLSVHLSLQWDETSARSIWHVPATHYLEEWSDVRAFDGTASIVQPLIAPLYEASLSKHELISILADGAPRGSYDIVRSFWRGRLAGEFDQAWMEVLRLGRVPNTGLFSRDEAEASRGTAASGPTAAAADTAAAFGPIAKAAPEPPTRARRATDGATRARRATDGANRNKRNNPRTYSDPLIHPSERFELVFRPDPTVWDGRYAGNAWLQELPKPLTKLVWENALLIAPEMADRMGARNGRMLEVSFDDRSLRGPAWIAPGHPPDTVTAFLGYGRSHVAGQDAPNGYNAYAIRTTGSLWVRRGAGVRVLDESQELVSTQQHHSMEGRRLVESATFGTFRDNPEFVHKELPLELPTLYPEFEYPRYKWGMVIDLNVCTGCNACVVACQAENNIPVVGKEEVGRGREMHWLRVDRYYRGSAENPEAFFQPVPCMHCETAPCEVVCPVYATVHDSEGLNVMVYNRCIGTRYCSNNCPYKVRRFNFLEYADWREDSRTLQKNPDVTVRSRGVMEKCTYCVQRISAARIRAKSEVRTIRDGEVKTACQMACPTRAIAFGDLNDAESEVSVLEQQPHNYKLLHELGTRPRTSYLAHFRNKQEGVRSNE